MSSKLAVIMTLFFLTSIHYVNATDRAFLSCDSRAEVPVYSSTGSLTPMGGLACGQEVVVLGLEAGYPVLL